LPLDLTKLDLRSLAKETKVSEQKIDEVENHLRLAINRVLS